MIQTYLKQTYFVKELGRDVEITILSNAKSKQACPLIIMNDGQNLFEDQFAAYGRSWRLFDLFEKNDQLPLMRIVGVSNNQIGHGRLNEYSPFICSNEFGTHAGFGIVGGKGDDYVDWLSHQLIPMISKKYPSTEIYLGGSSMGGFISLYAGLKYPNIYKGIFGLSNAWWFAFKPMMNMIKNFEGTLPNIYLDTGSHESRNRKLKKLYVDLHHEIVQAIQVKQPSKFTHQVIEKGLHNEEAWSNRIEEVLINIIK
jgi:predicted alpha/beta superfamily hydrolase